MRFLLHFYDLSITVASGSVLSVACAVWCIIWPLQDGGLWLSVVCHMTDLCYISEPLQHGGHWQVFSVPCIACWIMRSLQHGGLRRIYVVLLDICNMANFGPVLFETCVLSFIIRSFQHGCLLWLNVHISVLGCTGGCTKQDMSIQWWLNVWPTSPSLDQHYISIGSVFVVILNLGYQRVFLPHALNCHALQL